jgi:hypothetical protein
VAANPLGPGCGSLTSLKSCERSGRSKSSTKNDQYCTRMNQMIRMYEVAIQNNTIIVYHHTKRVHCIIINSWSRCNIILSAIARLSKTEMPPNGVIIVTTDRYTIELSLQYCVSVKREKEIESRLSACARAHGIGK